MRTKKQFTTETSEINLVGITANISRCYEISQVGGHSITFAYYSDKDDSERNVNPKDIALIASFYGVKPSIDGDIIVEVCRPSFDEITMAKSGRFETLDEINERVKKAKEIPLPSLNLNSVCLSLFKTAYERLGLALYEIEIINKVAQTIARMAFSNEIKPEHLAEAIQYRAINKNETTKIY